jgi:hypothetical protein
MMRKVYELLIEHFWSLISGSRGLPVDMEPVFKEELAERSGNVL